MDFIYILLIVPVVVALLTRSWLVVLIPLVGVPLYVIGKDQRWWGCCGTGDSWQAGMVLLTAIGVAGAAVGVTLGRMIAGHVRPPRERRT